MAKVSFKLRAPSGTRVLFSAAGGIDQALRGFLLLHLAEDWDPGRLGNPMVIAVSSVILTFGSLTFMDSKLGPLHLVPPLWPSPL